MLDRAGNGWIWLEEAGLAGNGWKWLKTVGMTGNGLKCLKMPENGYKLMDMAKK